MLIEEVEVELTSLCNAHCQLCYRNYKTYEKSNIIRPIQEVIQQLEEYKDLRSIKLVGVESEPTLHPDFFVLIKWLKMKEVVIEICTNGDTNNEEWWEELGELLHEDDEVYFTICGSTQELHETYRKGTRLDHILRNARAMRNAGKCTDYAQCIRFEYNNDDFESDAFNNMVGEFSHVYWTETYLHKSSDNYVDVKGIDKLKPPRDKQNDYHQVELLADALYKAKGFNQTLCIAQEARSVQIDVYGTVYPCYLHKEAKLTWDGNWDRINRGEIETCKFCIKGVRQLCHDKDLQYVI